MVYLPCLRCFFGEIRANLGPLSNIKTIFFVGFLAVLEIIQSFKSVINKLIVNLFAFCFTIIYKCFHCELFVTKLS